MSNKIYQKIENLLTEFKESYEIEQYDRDWLRLMHEIIMFLDYLQEQYILDDLVSTINSFWIKLRVVRSEGKFKSHEMVALYHMDRFLYNLLVYLNQR